MIKINNFKIENQGIFQNTMMSKIPNNNLLFYVTTNKQNSYQSNFGANRYKIVDKYFFL